MGVISGAAIGNRRRHHRHRTFLGFLSEIDSNLSIRFGVHLLIGNYSMRRVGKLQAWLASHLRYRAHFTRISES